MPTIDELAARVADLEQALAPIIAPRAAVPPITIGELTTVPTPGATIASQWTNDITRRGVHRFASVAARDAAYPAASAGNGAICVTLDTGRVWVVNNGVWLPPGFGEVAYVEQPSPQGPVSGLADISGMSITFTSVVGARYELLGSCELSTNNAGTTLMKLYITDAANGIVQVRMHSIIAGSYGHFTVFRDVTPGGGSVTYKLRADASAGTWNANDQSNVAVLRAQRVA